jgi:putative polyhydroxyalkanoate system protein
LSDIHIQRQHQLGLPQARALAFKWAEQAEQKFDMQCTYQEGAQEDEVSFRRAGVSGRLQVSSQAFVLDAKLGFLLSAFKAKIEAEITKNLDGLLASSPPAAKPAAAKKSSPRKSPKP